MAEEMLIDNEAKEETPVTRDDLRFTVLESFFVDNHAASQQLRSFDDFATRGIKRVLRVHGTFSVNDLAQGGQSELVVQLDAKSVRVERPRVVDDVASATGSTNGFGGGSGGNLAGDDGNEADDMIARVSGTSTDNRGKRRRTTATTNNNGNSNGYVGGNKPRVVENLSDQLEAAGPLYPREARARSLTYQGRLLCTVFVERYRYESGVAQTSEIATAINALNNKDKERQRRVLVYRNEFQNVCIGYVPVMVGSHFCNAVASAEDALAGDVNQPIHYAAPLQEKSLTAVLGYRASVMAEGHRRFVEMLHAHPERLSTITAKTTTLSREDMIKKSEEMVRAAVERYQAALTHDVKGRRKQRPSRADLHHSRCAEECPLDEGGYFIVRGSERVVVGRERNAANHLFVAKHREVVVGRNGKPVEVEDDDEADEGVDLTRYEARVDSSSDDGTRFATLRVYACPASKLIDSQQNDVRDYDRHPEENVFGDNKEKKLSDEEQELLASNKAELQFRRKRAVRAMRSMFVRDAVLVCDVPTLFVRPVPLSIVWRALGASSKDLAMEENQNNVVLPTRFFTDAELVALVCSDESVLSTNDNDNHAISEKTRVYSESLEDTLALTAFTGIVDRRKALEFVGRRLTDQAKNNVSTTAALSLANVEFLLEKWLLPHVTTGLKKSLFLCDAVRRLLAVTHGHAPLDSRDSTMRSKRVDLTGALLESLLSRTFALVRREIERSMDGNLRDSSTANNGGSNSRGNAAQRPFNPRAHFSRCNTIGSAFSYALATGNWAPQAMYGRGVTMTAGVAQAHIGINRLARMSAYNRVRSGMGGGGRDEGGSRVPASARHLQVTHWGTYCACETPEGQEIGVTKNLALTCQFSLYRDKPMILAALQKFVREDPDDTSILFFDANCDIGEMLSSAGSGGGGVLFATKILLNGEWCGVTTRARRVLDAWRRARRSNELPADVSVAFDVDENKIHVWCDAGRACRPLLLVDDEKDQKEKKTGKLKFTRHHARRLALGNALARHESTNPAKTAQWLRVLGDKLTWGGLVREGLMEFVDGREMETLRVAMFPEDLLSGGGGGSTASYTHCEIAPVTILGHVASLVAYANYNQSPRLILHTAQAKHAQAVLTTRSALRFDTLAYELWYPQKSLVATQTTRALRVSEAPTSQVAVVAIMPCEGYNQEDAVVVNQASIDRGFLRSAVSRTFSVSCRRRVPLPGFVVAAQRHQETTGRNNLKRTRETDVSEEMFQRWDGADQFSTTAEMSEKAATGLGDLSLELGVVEVLVGERFARATQFTSGAQNLKNYALIDADGTPRVGMRYQRGHVIIGRVLEYAQFHPRMGLRASHSADASIVWSEDVSVVCTKVVVVDGEDGARTVHATFTSMRVPEVGDKGAFRPGQKGCMGLARSPEDLPHSARDGTIPDVYINPHAFPSRMTMGLLVEQLMFKAACSSKRFKGNGDEADQYDASLLVDQIQALVSPLFDSDTGVFMGGTTFPDAYVDATAFIDCAETNAGKKEDDERKNVAIERAADWLHTKGFQRYGYERMISGHTGRPLQALIVVGPADYQRLRHMAADKAQSRARNGPRDPLTHQPVAGRARGGATRFGEMEQQAILSHGGAGMLRDRLLLCSDAYDALVCRLCGSMTNPAHNAKNNRYNCRRCQTGDPDAFSWIKVPYPLHLLVYELTAMNIRIQFELGVNVPPHAVVVDETQ
jgi:DNA-directed RNA polymerase beta subunit